jgi:hypothetical protein
MLDGGFRPCRESNLIKKKKKKRKEREKRKDEEMGT